MFKWSAPALALLLSAAALAQPEPTPVPAFELERLVLNPGAEGSLLLGTGELMPEGGLRVALTGHYERNPLLLYRFGSQSAVVENRATAHLSVAYAILGWLELGAQVPVTVFQNGADLTAKGLLAPAATGLGTPALSARVGLLSSYNGAPLDLALDLALGIPLGSAAALDNDNGVRFTPKLMFGKQAGAVRFGLEAGVLLRKRQTLNPGADTVKDELGPELQGGVVLASNGDGIRAELDLLGAYALSKSPSAAEALVGLRIPAGNALEFYVLGGLGFGSQPGTPLFRVLLGAAYASVPKRPVCEQGLPHTLAQCPMLDDDGDGVRNGDDRCPTEAGTAARGGCPVTDTDKDGTPDELDKCPTESGPIERGGCPVRDGDKDGIPDELDKCPAEAGTPERGGCPVRDGDKDGIPDEMDKCPAEAGPSASGGCPDGDGDTIADKDDKCPAVVGDADSGGCPRDGDTDGVPDKVDNCPKEAGPADNQGCPVKVKQLVEITREKLVIKGKVYFDTNKARIQERSYGLLNQVAKVLVEHPEITIVHIEGHTDNVGNDEHNRKLSQRRAESVKDYIVDKGVAAKRLDPKGFGPDRPADTNKTSKGRENNRRVEFIISADVGADAAQDKKDAPPQK